MPRRTTRPLAVFALALVGWLASCDSIAEPTLPDLRPRVPSFAWSILQENACEKGVSTSQTVDSKGGRLALCGHELVIPKGAVDEPTLFTMKKSDSDVKVELTAGRDDENDVGEDGFNKPVTLSLSYASALELPSDLSLLKVVWVKPDGEIEAQSSKVDTRKKTVTADLEHFSDYAMGWPN